MAEGDLSDLPSMAGDIILVAEAMPSAVSSSGGLQAMLSQIF